MATLRTLFVASATVPFLFLHGCGEDSAAHEIAVVIDASTTEIDANAQGDAKTEVKADAKADEKTEVIADAKADEKTEVIADAKADEETEQSLKDFNQLVKDENLHEAEVVLERLRAEKKLDYKSTQAQTLFDQRVQKEQFWQARVLLETMINDGLNQALAKQLKPRLDCVNDDQDGALKDGQDESESCSWYEMRDAYCGQYDTVHFKSNVACCACRGGIKQAKDNAKELGEQAKDKAQELGEKAKDNAKEFAADALKSQAKRANRGIVNDIKEKCCSFLRKSKKVEADAPEEE